MSNLDDKLLGILEEYPASIHAVEAIKDAFADAGYTQGDNGTQAWNNEFMAKHNMMTGQEWYDRFEILAKESGYYSDDLPMMKLARRAAGIEETE